MWSLKDSIYALQKDDIWKISIIFESVHIFYETDAQITAHEEDGTSGSLTEMIIEIVKVHDRYQVFKDGVPCVFYLRREACSKRKGMVINLERDIDLKEISDGRLYTANDMVKIDCNDCAGCSANRSSKVTSSTDAIRGSIITSGIEVSDSHFDTA